MAAFFLATAALCLVVLSSCIPKGAKNWPYSIGPRTYATALGDLDGDGDLDAYMANGENEVPVPNSVWMNDGSGHFSDSGQQIGEHESWHVLLADLDRDADLDALVGNVSMISFYRNDGQGVFGGTVNLPRQDDMGAYLLAPAVGDVNEDGWPDVLGGGCCGGIETWDDGHQVVHTVSDTLWLSEGGERYLETSQEFDQLGTPATALGDLDGDGDVDAFLVNSGSLDAEGEMVENQADTIWINDGHGTFSPNGQELGRSTGQSVVLGDLDADGDLDAFVGNQGEDEVWLNAGGRQGGTAGMFLLDHRQPGRNGEIAFTGQKRSRDTTRAVLAADVDNDGDLDVLAVGEDQANFLMNDGSARFTIGVRFNFEPQHALAVGDVNGDGFTDVFAGSVNHGIFTWINEGNGEFVKVRAD